MRYFEYTQQLNEYSRDVTAQKLGAALLQKFSKESDQWQARIVGHPVDDNAKLDRLLGHVEHADPTKNKQYVPWIIRMYVNTPTLKFEDAVTKVTEPLRKFFKLVSKKQIPAPNNDIGRVKDLAQLTQLIDQFPDVVDQPKDANRGQAKEFYRDSDIRVIVPEDETAACYYGQGTKWCTAATGGNNMFNRYNQQGPMYIILPTKPQHTGEKYQLHFDTKQYMDEADKPINLSELVKRFPQLRQVFQQQAGQYKINALLLEPEEYQQLYGRFAKEFTSQLTEFMYENSNEIAQDLYKSLWREQGKILRQVIGADEFYEAAQEAFSEFGVDLVKGLMGAVGDNFDILKDEDQMYDILNEVIRDWADEQDFAGMVFDAVEDLGTDDDVMDVSYTIIGEISGWLNKKIEKLVGELL